jgi:hypothetical protein
MSKYVKTPAFWLLAKECRIWCFSPVGRSCVPHAGVLITPFLSVIFIVSFAPQNIFPLAVVSLVFQL